jgi:hypothetical protein
MFATLQTSSNGLCVFYVVPREHPAKCYRAYALGRCEVADKADDAQVSGTERRHRPDYTCPRSYHPDRTADQVEAGAEKTITKDGENYVALIDADRLVHYQLCPDAA